jgi:hypothetical protein
MFDLNLVRAESDFFACGIAFASLLSFSGKGLSIGLDISPPLFGDSAEKRALQDCEKGSQTVSALPLTR